VIGRADAIPSTTSILASRGRLPHHITNLPLYSIFPSWNRHCTRTSPRLCKPIPVWYGANIRPRAIEHTMATTKRHSDDRTPEDVSTEQNDMESLHAVETNNRRPDCFTNILQELLFVLTCTMAIAMPAYVAGMITVISSFVGRDLNMSTAEITWLTSATSLASGAFLLFFGGVADLFGRRMMFVASMLLFAVFSLVAGFAKNAIALDVLNGVMGLFAASAVPPAVGLLGIVYEKPSKRKNWAFACFSGGNPLGFVFGTIFSGAATDVFNWRASYYLLAIIFLFFSILGWFTVPKDPSDKQPFTWETIKRFDVVGVLMTIGGIGMFSAALSLGEDAAQGWRTSYVLALLIIGAALMIGFVFWELHIPNPLVPMWMWKDRNFALSLAILMLGVTAFSPGAFFIALYFQDVWNMSALQVAVHVLPMAVMGILVNVFAGLVLHKISNKLLMYIGTIAYIAAFLLLAFNRHSSSYWAFSFPAFVLMVVGADLEFNVANMYVMSSMPPAQQSIAGGIFQTVTRLCMTVGFGVTTALFNAVQKSPRMASYWDRETQPYTATFWFAVACSVVSIGLVPFLTLTTQGGKVAEPGESTSLGKNIEKVQMAATSQQMARDISTESA
jgi:MFS family permease